MIEILKEMIMEEIVKGRALEPSNGKGQSGALQRVEASVVFTLPDLEALPTPQCEDGAGGSEEGEGGSEQHCDSHYRRGSFYI